MHNAQPQLAENMDPSLQDINTQVEISIQCSSTQKHSNFTPNKFHTTEITNQKVPTQAPKNNKSSMIYMTTEKNASLYVYFKNYRFLKHLQLKYIIILRMHQVKQI